MRWAITLILVSMLILAGCAKTGVPECDYKPGKITGDAKIQCPGVVYYNAKEGTCMVKAAGMGENCPTGAFTVDTSDMLGECMKSVKVPSDIEYCNFKVAEKTVNDALKLCQEKCEGLK